MGTCSNFNCNNHAWGKKFRCPKCRHAKDYTCTDCGLDVNSNRAVRCKVCAMAVRSLQNRIKTDDNNEKYRTDEEYRSLKNSKNLERYHKNKQLNNTVTVD